MTPKVKPLVWQERSPSCFMAETIAGAYTLQLDQNEDWNGYWEPDKRDSLWEDIEPSSNLHHIQATCQSHWNSLVLSLLETETLNAEAARQKL